MERINNSHIEGIQNEYRRINSKWLRMHFRLLLWLVAFTTAMETAMYFVLKRLGAISTSDHMYLVKYLLVPLLCNLTACGAAAGFMRSRLTLEKKICAVSLLTAAVAFFVYSFHSVFFALFLVFAIPPLLTTAYGDRKLTVITSTVCRTCSCNGIPRRSTCSPARVPWWTLRCRWSCCFCFMWFVSGC